MNWIYFDERWINLSLVKKIISSTLDSCMQVEIYFIDDTGFTVYVDAKEVEKLEAALMSK